MHIPNSKSLRHVSIHSKQKTMLLENGGSRSFPRRLTMIKHTNKLGCFDSRSTKVCSVTKQLCITNLLRPVRSIGYWLTLRGCNTCSHCCLTTRRIYKRTGTSTLAIRDTLHCQTGQPPTDIRCSIRCI